MSKKKKRAGKSKGNRGATPKKPKTSAEKPVSEGPAPAVAPAANADPDLVQHPPTGWRPRLAPRRSVFWALSVLSGVLWFMSCADHDIIPLAWIAMVPSLWVIENAPTRRQAFFYCWIAGIVANVGGFYWVTGLLTRFGHLPMALAILGLLLLAAYQAIVFLLFAAVLRKIREVSKQRLGKPLPMALLCPVVMVSFELLVPFIFPWYLAITQAWVPLVIQISELTGPLGVTALLMTGNGAVYDLLTEKTRRRKVIAGGGAAAFVALALIFGAIRIHQVDEARANAPTLRIGLVQGNIPFDEKGYNRQDLAGEQLRGLQSESARLEAEGAELIVWSESSYPFLINRLSSGDFGETSPWRVRRNFQSPLIFGAITRKPGDAYPYNSALMLNSQDEFVGRFDKIFLLIFGEYIPFLETFPSLRKILPQTAGHFARGESITTFPLEKDGVTYRLGPMICYEDILTDFGRKLAALHPHLLVNITNDAWFGDTAEPWEHMALSVYRAVEMRTDMVRAVNTGVSVFIDANGRVLKKTYAVDPKINPVGVDGIVSDVALMEGGHTVYARVGDVFGYGCTLATLFLWLVWGRLRRRREA